MSTIEPVNFVHQCPDCKIKMIPSGFGKYRCDNCGHIDKSEYDNTLRRLFGIGS